MGHFNLYALDFHYYRWWKIACIYRFDPYSFHANAILWWAEFMQRTAIQFILYCIVQHVFACYCFHRICEVRNTKPNYTNSDRKHTHAGRERKRWNRDRIPNLVKTWINVYTCSYGIVLNTNALYCLPLRQVVVAVDISANK